MRKHITTAFLVGALSTVAGVGLAATPGRAQTSTAAKHASTKRGVTYATRGVVRSVDASTLVITRTGKTHGEITFVLTASTHREGRIAPGAPVSVRYRQEGKTNVATAIRVQRPTQSVAHTAPPRR